MTVLSVEVIPFLHNNYAFVIYDEENGKAAATEVGRAAPVEKFLTQNNLELTQVWVTHYHFDHCEESDTLAQKYNCPIYGPRNAPTGFDVTPVDAASKLTLAGEVFQIIETPGHVEDHLAFYNKSNRILFPGDTLFGCGAAVVISDDARRLWQTMQKLRILPDSTRVYFPHEVTARNIRFALKHEPENEALKLRYNFTRAQLKQKRMPCPSMLQMEKQTNPFLRADDKELQTALGMTDKSGEDVFLYLMNQLEKSYGMHRS